MAFRGYFDLDGTEFANSSRVVEHLRRRAPSADEFATYAEGSTVALAESPPGSGLYVIPPGSSEDDGLYTSPGLTGELPLVPTTSTTAEYGKPWPEDPVGSYLYVGSPMPVERSPLLFDVPDTTVEVTPLVYDVPYTYPSPYDCGLTDLRLGYDDSWPELPLYLGHTDEYKVTNAPWFRPSIQESWEFLGVWVMDVQGLDTRPIQRDVAEAVGAGGVANPHRDMSRPITFNALIVARSSVGAEFGLRWLNAQMRKATGRSGAEMRYWSAHPSGSLVDPQRLRRRVRNVVLTTGATITDLGGKGGGRPNRQASMFRCEWTLTALDPYAYTEPDELPVVWASTETDPIEWVHAPDCTDDAACSTDMPVLFNADCEPSVVTLTTTPIPTCGGCLPVCAIERRTFVLPATFTGFDATAVSTRVTNTGSGNLTVNMYWRPVGSTAVCDRDHYLQVSGLPPGATAVADSESGRPYAEVAGVRHRQVGIVSTQSGAPWSPMLVGRDDDWELVAESTPDAEYDVELVLVNREA